MPIGYRNPPTAETVKSRADIDATTGCWVWRLSKHNGYGMISIRGRVTTAHRFAYEVFVGPIPAGLTIDHLCRNRCCVNPAHLEPVTIKENTLRGEGPCARHARKTHCKNGHPFSGDNVQIRGEKYRVCRACTRARHSTPEYLTLQRERMRARRAAR